MAERDDDFLGRWSRRKVEARQGLRRVEPRPEEPSRDAAVPGQPSVAAEGGSGVAAIPATDAPEPMSEAETQAMLAEVETLTYESDFTRFVAKGVPAIVKQRALRKLWASNPIFGAHDGLDDYYVTADFTDAARAVPNVATSWRVGRGYMSDEDLAAQEEIGKSPEEVARLREARRLEAEAAEGEDAETAEAAEGAVADEAPAGAAAEASGEALAGTAAEPGSTDGSDERA